MIPNNKEAYQLLHDGVLALARAEQQGIRIDEKAVIRQERIIERKIRKIENEFFATKFFKDWERSKGKKVNIYSPQQLSHYLYKEKHLKPIKKTASDQQGATSEEVLEKLGIPELNKLVYLKQLRKVKNTYLASLKREVVDGYIHPFFNLHTTRTFRSSSDRPNFQNIPIRNEEFGKMIRGVIYPRPGHQLMEVDYGQLEARIAACYSKDENLIDGIIKGDLHRDWCMKIFKLDEFDYNNLDHKTLRSATKNGFVFPELYGSWYKNCAEGLVCGWGKLDKSFWKRGEGIKFGNNHLSDHLISKGIHSFDDFTNQLEVIERDFWRKYRTYEKWKDKICRKYQETGYIQTLTGFTLRDVMDVRKVINSPIQGSAFHCLLWSLIETTKVQVREHWDTKIIGQIHDSIVLDVAPDESEKVIKIMKCIMCNDVRQHWKWIIVPLDVNVELSPVDKSWDEKQDYEC